MIAIRAKTGGKVPMVALIAVAVLVAGGGGLVMGQKMMAKGKPDKASKSEGTPKDAKTDGGGETSSGGDAKEGKDGKHDAEAPAVVVEIGEFLVNLEGGTDARYLRTEVSVRLSGLPVAPKKSEGAATNVEKLPSGDLAVARDCVTTALSSGVFEQLRTGAGREKLKQDVLAKLQKALPKYQVCDVLFTSFVMQ